MRPKFDIKNFEKLSNNKIILECEFCKKEFNSTKKYIKRVLGISKNTNSIKLKYCSKECSNKSKMTGKYVKCFECNLEVYRTHKQYNKNNSGHFFCSPSCKAIDWNKNKNYGFNRSKIEEWIEEELINRYNFEILFNNRDILNKNYELDIYIPKLNLAFELNGIFHYDAIFGKEKLKIIENKDLEKINECECIGVKLFVIDITDSKNFNKSKDKKYLDFIIREIDLMLGDSIKDSLIIDKTVRKIVKKKKSVKNICECGKEIKKNSKNCLICSQIKQRKVERPSYESLKEDIGKIGYSKCGEKYLVDRTLIYKWIKYYEKENEK